MAIRDYNTNTAVPGLKGLQLYEGDADYEKKKLYKESGITWQDLMQNDPETAYKWASEQLSRNPFRLPNKPVTDDEVANYLNNVSTPSPDMSSIRTMEDLLNESVRTSEEAVVNKLANAQQIADETGYGNSKYDTENEVSLDEMQYLKDIRAAEQSNFAKLGVSGLKAATLAGTTFLDGTVGFIYGVGSAVANGDVNKINANAVSDALQGINNWMEEVAPMYTSEYYDSKPWYQKLNTVELWSDSVLKNMGFTVGALWSGSAATKLLRGIPKVAQSMKAQEILGSMYSAVSEGRIEANQTYHDLLDSTTGQINSAFERYLESIKDDEDYEQKANIALEQREQLLQEAEHNAASAGIQTALANTVLLSLTNYSTWGRMFSKDFNANKQLMFDGLRYNVDKQSFKGVLGNVGKDMFVEGNEEMLQQVASTWSKLSNSIEDPDYYNKAFMDVETKNDTYESLDALGTAFLNTYGNPDEWEQFFAGAATSLIGFGNVGRGNNSNNESVFKGSPVSWQGGILGKYLAMKRDNAEIEQQASALNAAIDKIQSQGNYFTRQAQLLNDMEGYIQNDDRFSYENTQDGLDFNTFSVFQRTGRLDDLKTIIGKDFENMSDSDLEELAKDFNKRTNDGSLVTDTPKGKENFRQELIANQEKMFDRLDKFEKSFSAIKSILPQLDDSQATELAWYHWKQDIFNDRFNDVYDRNKDNIDNLATTVDALINRNEHQFREAISPNIKKQTQVLKSLQPFLSSLKDANHISKVFAQGKLTTEGLEYMLNNRSIRNNSGMDAVTYKKTIDAINDINKMSTSVKSYNAKLQDYLEHPEKMNQMKEKEAQKKADKEETINRVKNEGNLLTKTPNQIAEEDINGRFSISDALNDPKLTKEIKDHLNKAQKLKNELLRKLNQVKEKQNEGTLSKEEAEAALNLIRRTANVAETPEGLSDPALLKAVNEESGINIDGIDELIAKISDNEKPVSEPVGTSLDDILSNIDESEPSEESLASGKDGQPKLNPVNNRAEEFERFLNKGSDTPVEESTNNLKAYTNWIYNVAWVQENPTTESVLGALPSTLGVDAATLGAIANEAIYLRDTVKELYADASDTLNEIAVKYGSKKELMDRLYKLATEVKPIVIGGITDENVIISKLSKPSYTAFNTESDASKNPLNKFIEALVSYYSDNQGNTNEAAAESQEDVEKQQLVEKQQQAVNTKEKQKETLPEDNQPSYTKKENDKNTYWRPNVPLLPFGSIFKKDPRNYTPFWQRLSSLFKDEKLIKRSSAIGSYLQEHGAYDRIDSGKIPKTVYFKVDAALNRNADDFVVLMVNEDNEVVGDLPALGDNAVNNSIGLKEFVEEIQRQYEEAGSPETWNAPKYLKTEVNEVLLGKAPYSTTEVNSAAEIFSGRDIKFQVNPITKLPYIEVDFFGKTLQFTFITPYLNESMRNKEIGNFITDRLRKALLAKNNDERIKNVRQINGLMNNDITVYGNKDGSIDVKIISEDGTTTPILKNAVITNDNMVSALDSIWNSLYGSQVIIRPGEFKSSFADGVYLNLPKNMRLMSTWFTVKPITVNGDIIEAGKVTNKNLYTASTNKREAGDIIIETAGGIIKVNPENWIATNDKGDLLPSNNNTVKQALAKAVVVHNGWDLNTSHTTMFGDYIPDGYKATQEKKEVTSNTTNSIVPPKVATQPVVQPSVNNGTEGKYKNFAEFIGKHPEYKNNPNVYNYFNRYNTDGKSIEDIDKAISNELKKAEEEDPLFRKEENQNKSQVTNAEKSWLNEALPQFSDEDRLKIVERLQYKGVKAWGMFKNGVITLASNASSGTLYHEAFHAVTHCLLSQDEKFDMFSEASNKYGKQYSKRDLEELLAEDFRRYMQFSETPVIGKIARLFRWLKHMVKTLAGNESIIDKLMYDIASGKLKNRSIQSDSSTMLSSEVTDEIQKEMEEIKAKAIADGTFMKAPNGKPSNLNERQWLHVRTKAFKDWFGDWENDPSNASKVVDENGEPLVVYHGTTSNFDAFSKEYLGKYTGSSSAKLAFFATSNRDMAKDIYAEMETNEHFYERVLKYDSGFTKEDLGIGPDEQTLVDKVYDEFAELYANLNSEYKDVVDDLQKHRGSHKETISSTINKKEEWVTEIGLEDYIKEGYKISEEQQQEYKEGKDITISKETDVFDAIKYEEADKILGTERSSEYVRKLEELDRERENTILKAEKETINNENYKVKPLFLNIRNPKVDSDFGKSYRHESYSKRVESAINNNNDGGIIKDTKDPYYSDVYYFLEPNQAKSASDNIGTYSNEEDNIYFRFIDFTSMQGLQEHIDRTFNVGRRTKESVLNSWGKTADVWRACGINVRAKWVKKPNQEGRLVLTKLETYPVNNYLTGRRESYDNLYDDELEILAYRGINREEYNNLPACAKELIWKCAKLGF